jgi:hypothetical protein
LNKKVPQVKFVDRTFNCNHDHAYKIWSFIGEHDNGVTNFHFEISADLIREEDFELFQTFRPGLIQLEIGVQSTNPETIEAIHRKMDLDKLTKAVAKVHAGGNIHQHLDLIAGLPYEDYDSFGRSFNQVFAMRPDQLQLGFLKVLMGANMHEAAGEYDIRYGALPPYEVLSTKWLPYSEVLRLKQVEEMVEVYYNSFQFQASIEFLLIEQKSAFGLFEKLGDYYKKNGYFDSSCGRIDRYNILREFYGKYGKTENRQLFDQVLTYDLFLRDNVKNLPEFVAKVDKSQNSCIFQYYEDNCENEILFKDYEAFSTKQRVNMTCMRKFDFDMKALAMGEGLKRCRHYCYFDYKHRNPLNNSARVVAIPAEDFPMNEGGKA